MSSDREQIVDLMVRYGWAVDTRDWQLLHSCFLPDASINVEADGGIGAFRCLLQAQHVSRTAIDNPLYAVGGTYHSKVRRTAQGWRMSELHFAKRWTGGNPAVLAHIED